MLFSRESRTASGYSCAKGLSFLSGERSSPDVVILTVGCACCWGPAGGDVWAGQVAVPWFMLRRRGHEVLFATQSGEMSECDRLSVSGVHWCSSPAPPLVLDMHRGNACSAFLCTIC